MDIKHPAIYKITHIDSERCYVGSTGNVERRWGDHIRDFRGGRHHSPYFNRVWNKYGQDAFVFEILEELDLSGLSVDEMIVLFAEREQRWIDKFQPVFNSAPIAGSSLGYKWTDEQKAGLKGRKPRGPISDEERAKLNASKNPRHSRKPHSEETKKKIGDANRGKKRSPESVAKMMGHPVSPETRAKIGAANKAIRAQKKLEQ